MYGMNIVGQRDCPKLNCSVLIQQGQIEVIQYADVVEIWNLGTKIWKMHGGRTPPMSDKILNGKVTEGYG